MITKESLIQEKESANIGLLTLKQKYHPYSEEKYFIVEGKDDVAYYTCLLTRYTQGRQVNIIAAGNRLAVVETYKKMDWSFYAPNRIFFFVDRDLSFFTKEDTPTASNVYVTEEYSIENAIFTRELLITALRTFYNINDLEESEEEVLLNLYDEAKKQHAQIFFNIMSWILYWRLNNINCNLNNLNSGDFYKINCGRFELQDDFKESIEIERKIHLSCGVTYEEVDISDVKNMLQKCDDWQRYIRGKYVRDFFVKFLQSMNDSLHLIFPDKKKPKAVVTIGNKNALLILCGYAKTPESLDVFLRQAFETAVI